MPPARRGVWAGLLLAVVVHSGCASLAHPVERDGLVWSFDAWSRGDESLVAHWVLPVARSRPASVPSESAAHAATPGVIVMQHGFTRQCRHLAGLREALARTGWSVLCLDLPFAAGDAQLIADLADALSDGTLRPPRASNAAPSVVAGGFSAGGVFAVRLGEALVRRDPQRFAGAMLFDPVDSRGFGAGLQAIAAADRPVLSVLAEPGPCNAQGSATAPLLQAAGARPGRIEAVRLLRGSTHVDAEGENTSDLAIAACRQGAPAPRNVTLLRETAAQWMGVIDGRVSARAFAARLAEHERAGDLARLAGAGDTETQAAKDHGAKDHGAERAQP